MKTLHRPVPRQYEEHNFKTSKGLMGAEVNCFVIYQNLAQLVLPRLRRDVHVFDVPFLRH